MHDISHLHPSDEFPKPGTYQIGSPQPENDEPSGVLTGVVVTEKLIVIHELVDIGSKMVAASDDHSWTLTTNCSLGVVLTTHHVATLGDALDAHLGGLGELRDELDAMLRAHQSVLKRPLPTNVTAGELEDALLAIGELSYTFGDF